MWTSQSAATAASTSGRTGVRARAWPSGPVRNRRKRSHGLCLLPSARDEKNDAGNEADTACDRRER